MFKPVSNKVDFVKQEHDILGFWNETRAFEKLVQLRADGPHWSFIDGPITANNPMGVHHGWGRTYKDLFHRFKAMQGHQIRYQNGFDCQGLWVEVNVEKAMGFKSKRDIEEFGLAKFVELCKQRVLKYAAVQTDQSIRLGYWMDWDDIDLLNDLRDRLSEDSAETITVEGPKGPVEGSVEEIIGRLGMPEMGGSYFTFSDENNYTIWSVLKSCHDRGWIYKGRDVMPWCFRCGTGISQHEIVTEGYQELTHPSITLRLPLRNRENESLLVWTTTPWTLTSNIAAAVGPKLTYARVRQGDEVLILSEGTLSMLQGDYEVIETFKGVEMDGWVYDGPFDELPAQVDARGPEAHRIVLWDEVGEEEGTGAVHIAPGCGAEDFALSKEYDLPVVAPIDEGGIFMDGFAWLSGKHVMDVAKPIIEDLDEKGLLYNVVDYEHRYPVCWRCSNELVFRLVDEWFISMGDQLDKPLEEVTPEERDANLRYQMMEVVAGETQWHPSFGLDRELDWLKNMHDWMISKKRYWGLALPIYACDSCGHFDVIGSKEELEERAIEGWDEFVGHTPHRPYIDAVKIACSHCGETTSRIKDVGNPWLDAGIVGMSTLQYNEDRAYWEKWFPADLISESFPGQFRNWFYSLIAMSTILERKAPFEHVFSYATLVAEDGRAMHKSWGNAIEFNEAADKMGVDVMRWMYTDHKPERDLLFGYNKADEVRRQILIPLWNVYSFFVTYAELDGWTPANFDLSHGTELDRWLLARLNEVIEQTTDSLEAFEPNEATGALGVFLDDLSNWYLRRSRRRFWAKTGESQASDEEKLAAYSTLYYVLENLVRLLAPFMPFVTEVMYQNLVRSFDAEALESVHHAHWPEVDQALANPQLTREMKLVAELVSLGHAARNQASVKLRQPLQETAFSVGSKEEGSTVQKYMDLIADELNVKTVRLLDAASEVVQFDLHPRPKQLGQRFKAGFPAVRDAVLGLKARDAAQRLLQGLPIQIKLDGEDIELQPDEVEVRVEAEAGFSATTQGSYVAALNTEVTEELKLEGLAREFVRRVQELRKEADLVVSDKIVIEYVADATIEKAVNQNRDFVVGETLAGELVSEAEPSGDFRGSYSFDGHELDLAITVRN